MPNGHRGPFGRKETRSGWVGRGRADDLMLVLLFSVKPAAAISSDLVASVVMRPAGAVVHLLTVG